MAVWWQKVLVCSYLFSFWKHILTLSSNMPHTVTLLEKHFFWPWGSSGNGSTFLRKKSILRFLWNALLLVLVPLLHSFSFAPAVWDFKCGYKVNFRTETFHLEKLQHPPWSTRLSSCRDVFVSNWFVASVSCRDDQHSGGAEADGSLCQWAQLHSVEWPELQPGSVVFSAVPHRLPRGNPGVHPGPLYSHWPQARLGQ